MTFGKNLAVLPKGTGSRKVMEILREPTEQALAMLTKTIHSSFKRQRAPVVTYDRASSWPGK